VPDLHDITGDGYGQPAGAWFNIGPSDSTNLTIIPRAIYVGVSGDVAAVDVNGTVCVFKSLAVGWHPIRPRRINSTSTTATNIIGVY
jgi:hypothetical protein